MKAFSNDLNASDWFVIAITLIATLTTALYGSWKHKKLCNQHQSVQHNKGIDWVDYILMGRQLTLPMFVATLVATWYGDITGVTQIAFQYGIYGFFTQGFFWYIVYILFAHFAATYIRKQAIISFPDLFKRLVGTTPATFSAWLIFLKILPVNYALGMGLLLKTLFGISLNWAVGLSLGFTLLYTSFGGFKAVVLSDMLQVTIMFIGLIAVPVFSFFQFGGAEYLLQHCPASHFAFTSTYSVLDTCVWFFIALSTTFLNPTFYQRCLSAKTNQVAIWGIYISTFCFIVMDLTTVLIGLYAKAFFQHEQSVNAALLYSIMILPHGLKGLFIGAVMAAILSTLDSFLFLAKTTLTYDLSFLRSKNKTLNHLFAGLLTCLCTFLIVLLYEGNFEPIWRLTKGFIASCLFPALTMGYFFPKKITAKHFGIACSMILSVMVFWHIYKPYPLDSFYIGQLTGFCILGFLYMK